MTKRILYIDMFCPEGHINLNKNFIYDLSKKAEIIDFVFKKNYLQESLIKKNKIIWEASNWYFSDSGKFVNRIKMILFLYIIRFKYYNKKKYDYVFFSSYDEIALYLSGFRSKLILVNHGNIACLSNPFKRYFLKKLSKFSVFVVFHNLIKEECFKYGITNVDVQSIGLNDKYYSSEFYEKNISEFDFFKLIKYKENIDYIIFIPTGSKYENNFIESILLDNNFINFITRNNMLLIIKDNTLKIEKSKNIIIINNHISHNLYKWIFLKSDLILLSYPESFRFKISAILFECFSNSKPCILSKITFFEIFKNNFNYDPFFEDVETLMNTILKVKAHKDTIEQIPFNNLNSFEIDFQTSFF